MRIIEIITQNRQRTIEAFNNLQEEHNKIKEKRIKLWEHLQTLSTKYRDRVLHDARFNKDQVNLP